MDSFGEGGKEGKIDAAGDVGAVAEVEGGEAREDLFDGSVRRKKLRLNGHNDSTAQPQSTTGMTVQRGQKKERCFGNGGTSCSLNDDSPIACDKPGEILPRKLETPLTPLHTARDTACIILDL